MHFSHLLQSEANISDNYDGTAKVVITLISHIVGFAGGLQVVGNGNRSKIIRTSCAVGCFTTDTLTKIKLV